MIEIELKARVEDARALVRNVCSWAEFQGCHRKDDVYWGDARRQVQLRVRRERLLFSHAEVFETPDWRWPFAGANGIGDQDILRPLAGEGAGQEEIVVTYKRKQVVEDSCEVNQEEEFHVDRSGPLESFLQAAGFSVVLQKVKLVATWRRDGCGIELCRIPELGDFLELEIVRESGEAQVVAECRRQLRQVLARCGIGEEAIEPRFYCQLLDEARGRG